MRDTRLYSGSGGTTRADPGGPSLTGASAIEPHDEAIVRMRYEAAAGRNRLREYNFNKWSGKALAFITALPADRRLLDGDAPILPARRQERPEERSCQL